MTTTKNYAIAAHVVLSDADSGAVLLDTKKGRYWQLNSTGARIIRLIGDGHSETEVADILLSEMDSPRDRIVADIAALLESLYKNGLLVKQK